ncbi:MAG: hypothetical protein RLZZ433_1127 [Pseudomonadota bacterium]|jgi:hypothetical protein
MFRTVSSTRASGFWRPEAAAVLNAPIDISNWRGGGQPLIGLQISYQGF